MSGKLSNNIRIEGFVNSKGIYSYKEDSTLENFIDENDILDSTYLPFSIISRKGKDGSREYLSTDLNNETRKNFKLFPNDLVYVFSEYDLDFINSALLADALGLLSEEDKQSLDIFYSEQNKDQDLAQSQNEGFQDLEIDETISYRKTSESENNLISKN